MAEQNSTLKSGIYQIRHIESGKVYIGSATTISTRWNAHRSYLSKDKHHSKPLQRAWNKYGADAFVFEIVELVPVEDMVRVEQEYLDRLKPFAPDGYNVGLSTDAPMRGRKHTPEVCERMSQARIGSKRSPETRAKMKDAWTDPKRRAKGIAALTGRKHSPETKAKMSASQMTPEIQAIKASRKGIKKSPESIAKTAAGRRGQKHTPESLAKMSAAHSTPEAKAARVKRNKSRVWTPEARAKLSVARKGKKRSPETNAAIVAAMTGRKHSEETLAKMRATWERKRQQKQTQDAGDQQATFGFLDD